MRDKAHSIMYPNATALAAGDSDDPDTWLDGAAGPSDKAAAQSDVAAVKKHNKTFILICQRSGLLHIGMVHWSLPACVGPRVC